MAVYLAPPVSPFPCGFKVDWKAVDASLDGYIPQMYTGAWGSVLSLDTALAEWTPSQPIYPAGDEQDTVRAAAWVASLKAKGYKDIAIVSHSLGAAMANQYLIKTDDKTVKAWVFIGIINGLEEMFRIKIPVLDVFGGKDWEVTQVGA